MFLLSDLKSLIEEAESNGADEFSEVSLHDFNSNICVWQNGEVAAMACIQEIGRVGE